jgi:HSP20 family protein
MLEAADGSLVTLTATPSIRDDVAHVQQQIRQRAYEISQASGPPARNPLADWLDAERELVWQPLVEVRQTRGAFEVVAAVPGVNPGELEVHVTPQDVLIRGAAAHDHEHADGAILFCEFSRGRLFRAVHLPERIDPDNVTADCHDGMLHITAPIVVCIRPKRDTRQEP